jgi:hypothetical protein
MIARLRCAILAFGLIVCYNTIAGSEVISSGISYKNIQVSLTRISRLREVAVLML